MKLIPGWVEAITLCGKNPFSIRLIVSSFFKSPSLAQNTWFLTCFHISNTTLNKIGFNILLAVQARWGKMRYKRAEERAWKRATTTNFAEFCQDSVKSTLRVPVDQYGQKWYHFLCLVLGYITASRNLSICEFQKLTYSVIVTPKNLKNILKNSSIKVLKLIPVFAPL